MLVLTWTHQPSHLLLWSRSSNTSTLTLKEHRPWWRRPPVRPPLTPRAMLSITRLTWKKQRHFSMQNSCSRRSGRGAKSRTCEVWSVSLVFCCCIRLRVRQGVGCPPVLPVFELRCLQWNCKSAIEPCYMEEWFCVVVLWAASELYYLCLSLTEASLLVSPLKPVGTMLSMFDSSEISNRGMASTLF